MGTQTSCLTIPKKMPAWSQKKSPTIPNKMPDNCQAFFPEKLPDLQLYRSAGQFSGIFFCGLSGTFFGDCQASFSGLSGNYFGISRLFLGYKKEPKKGKGGGDGFKVFNGVFVLSNVNFCYRSQHSDHGNHPFKNITTHWWPKLTMLMCVDGPHRLTKEKQHPPETFKGFQFMEEGVKGLYKEDHP